MVSSIGKVGSAVVVLFVISAVVSFYLPHIDEKYDPVMGVELFAAVESPSSAHLLGTDHLGRDIFSQVLRGAYHAFIHGIGWSIVGVPLLVGAAYAIAQLRSKQPSEDTLLNRYVQFGIFPLVITVFLFIISFSLKSFLSELFGFPVFVTWDMTLFLAPVIALLGWFAVGHDLEMKFRTKENIPKNLLLSGAALIFSYSALFDGMVDLAGITNPLLITTWGGITKACISAGQASTLYWLIPPIVCIYIFSRRILAVSYWLYNTGPREKYFFKEGWF